MKCKSHTNKDYTLEVPEDERLVTGSCCFPDKVVIVPIGWSSGTLQFANVVLVLMGSHERRIWTGNLLQRL